MENFVIPEIAPLFHNGQKVLTINQIAVLFKCNGTNIRMAFSRHRKDFIENEDYFFLNYEQLTEFKATNRRITSVNNLGYAPVSPLASSLYLWTKSGVYKISKFIDTDNAKLIYSALQRRYFSQITPPTLQENSTPENNLEKATLLVKIAELTDDQNFKESLLKRAAELL